jgi:hypothetical protein
MSISSLALRTTTFTATTTACVEYRTPATQQAKLLEWSFVNATTATAQAIGMGRPQAIGLTPVNVLFQRDDLPTLASVINGSLSWATSPTVPLIYHRRWSGTNVVGVGIVWTFPRGLTIPISFSLVVWNITTTVAADVNAAVDEG